MAQVLAVWAALALMARHGASAGCSAVGEAGAASLSGIAEASASGSATGMLEVGEHVWQAEDASWVHLDKNVFTGESMLIHTRTCEKHVLAAGEWSVHDLDGYAGLVNEAIEESGQQGSWATDHLKSTIFIQESPAGPVELLAAGIHAVQHKDCRLWEDARAEFHWRAVSWNACLIKAKVEQFVGHLLIPRAGAVWWWRLQDIHVNLNIKACMALSAPHSRWVGKRVASWTAWLTDCIGLPNSIMRGIVKGADDNGSNPADWPSCSTHAFVGIISRLAYLPRAKGGLGTATEQEAAAAYLGTLLSAAAGSEWSLDIFCDQHRLSWEPPRLLAGGMPVSLPVDAEGCVDIRGCVTPSAKPLLKALASAVAAWGPGHAGSQGGSISLCDLFRVCMLACDAQGSKWQLHRLFQQLCIRVGDRLEAILQARLHAFGKAGAEDAILRGVQLNLEQSTPAQLDKAQAAKAFAYWRATQEAAAIHSGLPVSFTLDATGVGKHSIQDCAVLWPTNVAAWLFPQVCPCSSHTEMFTKQSCFCLVNGFRGKKCQLCEAFSFPGCLLNNSGLFSKLFCLGAALAF